MPETLVPKIKENLKLLQKLYSRESTPLSVSINLTDRCNQRCIYCEIGRGLVRSDESCITLDDLRWIIDEMDRSGIHSLTLGGGEPFLYRDIFEVLRYAHEHGIECLILTNGMIIPHFSAEKISSLRECKTKIFISIDSFQEDKEEYIRGIENVLPQQVEAIEILVKQGIPVDIVTVISKHNYQDLFDVVVNGLKLGVNSVFFQPVLFASNFPDTEAIIDKKNLNIIPKHLREVEDQFSQITQFEKRNPIASNIWMLRFWLREFIESISSGAESPVFFEKLLKRFYCYSVHFDIAINYNGGVMPCNMLESSGSITDRDGKGLLEIWNDSCRPVRSMIQKQKYPYACKSCVCTFSSNFKCSIIRYPLSNLPALVNVLTEKLRVMRGAGI
jgi:MoaA/NifB/PqqE/SkfB family radical SAM enzyme